MILNPTTACQCGADKKASAQFCTACWAKLPAELKATYMAQLEALEMLLDGCVQYLKI